MENCIAQTDYRARRLFLMLYAEDESDLILTLTERSNCWFHFAYIKHDRDLHDDGTIVEPHWHMILQLSTNYSLFDVLEWFKKNTHQNAFGELVIDPKRCYEYLTHDTEASQEKVRYSKKDIRSDDLAYFMGAYAKTEQMVYDIIFNAPLPYMVRTYGREYVINRQTYAEFAQEMWNKMSKDEKESVINRNYFAQERVDVYKRMYLNDSENLV